MAGENSVVVVAALLSRRRFGKIEVCIFKRADHVTGAGAWEFPGGKCKSGESDSTALFREIKEELNIRIEVGDFIHHAEHQFVSKGKKIHVKLYNVSTKDPLYFDLVDHSDYAWVDQQDINSYRISTADLSFIPIVFQYLR